MQRYATRGVRFTAQPIPGGMKLPAELFDSVADNLIENALAKRREGVPVEVEAEFSTAGGAMLSVGDDGAPVPRNVAARLFEAAVPSPLDLRVAAAPKSRPLENSRSRRPPRRVQLQSQRRWSPECRIRRPYSRCFPRIPFTIMSAVTLTAKIKRNNTIPITNSTL